MLPENAKREPREELHAPGFDVHGARPLGTIWSSCLLI
jgi:hypothetical protein